MQKQILSLCADCTKTDVALNNLVVRSRTTNSSGKKPNTIKDKLLIIMFFHIFPPPAQLSLEPRTLKATKSSKASGSGGASAKAGPKKKVKSQKKA